MAARASTPGEAKDLEITGYNPATGRISLSFVPACGAADHHIEYGLIQDVRTYGYSGQDCGIGNTGGYDKFKPGSGSYFFVVVGDDGVSTEGSYGMSLINGAMSERPEDILDPVCPLVQDLSQNCDVFQVFIEVSEAIGVSDAPAVEPSVLVAVTETIGVTDTPAALPPVVVDVVEAVGVADGIEALASVLIDVTEAIGVSDAPTVEPSILVAVTEAIGVTDTPAALLPVVVDVVEAVGVADGIEALASALIDVTEAIGVSDVPVPGVSFDGMTSQSRIGSAVAGAGDLNQDGINDWLTGEPSHQADSGPVEAGAVAVHFGSEDPAELIAPDLIFLGAAAHDRAGVAVAGNFDFNGDGILDILIGAEQVNRTEQHDSVTGCDAGAPCGMGKAYLIYFDPDDPVFSASRLNLADVGLTIPGVVFEGVALGDRAGFAVAAGGRINAGTGQDILIGAPGRDTALGKDPGAVYAIFDNPELSGTVSLDKVACKLHPVPCSSADEIAGVVYEGAAAGDRLGFSCAFVGNVVYNQSANSYLSDQDIVMGAPGTGYGGDDSGTTYVADTGGIDIDTDTVEVRRIGETIAGVQIRGTQTGEQLGWVINAGGDSRLDGVPDLLIGAPFYDVGILRDAGRVIHTSEALTTGIYSADEVGVTIGGVIWTGEAEQDNLGRALDGVNDVTADGFNDVVLGAPFADRKLDGRIQTDAGSVYLVEGLPATRAGGTVSVSEIAVSVPGRKFAGENAGEHAGSSIAGARDIDNSGDDDFVVGAPGRDTSGGDPGAGRVYLVLKSESELTESIRSTTVKAGGSARSGHE
jgi:hypothetical protein